VLFLHHQRYLFSGFYLPEQKGQVRGDTPGSPHIIPERVAGRAPPPYGDVVLFALCIMDPDIGPGHMLLPCPGIV